MGIKTHAQVISRWLVLAKVIFLYLKSTKSHYNFLINLEFLTSNRASNDYG